MYRYIGSKEELIVSAASESVRPMARLLSALLETDPLPGPREAVGVISRQFDHRSRELGFDVSAQH